MKKSIIPLAVFAAISMAGSIQAAPLVINSPDHGETVSDGSIMRQGLHWDARRQELFEVITFSNQEYDSPTVHPQSDTLAFVLPGVRYDQAENLFYAISKRGERVPVAKFSPVLFGKVIQLLPGAKVYVDNSYGKVAIKLVKTEAGSAQHWTPIQS